MTKRPCPRCSRVLVERGYCDNCRASTPTAVNERDRGTSAERGYGAAWQRARRNYLAVHPICVDTYRRHIYVDTNGREVAVIVPSTDVDHIVAVLGPHDPLFWDVQNWQALCHECHAYKTVTIDGGLGRLKAAAGRHARAREGSNEIAD